MTPPSDMSHGPGASRPGMADPGAPGAAGQQPTEEELQAYLAQMREADPAELVAQAFQILAMGAEVKIGRPDARVLIDALVAVVDATKGRVQAQLTTGMTNAVRQLQMAQVQAEREGSSAGEPAAEDTAGDARQPGAPSQPGAQQGDEQRRTDRLWIPGR